MLMFCVACTKQTAENPQNATGQVSTPEVSQKVTSTSVVKATPSSVTISPGASAQASLQLSIDKGYHVNANPPSYPYLKATELEIPPANGLSVGFITYPNALTRKFAFAEGPLNVYEDQITIKINLRADKSAQQGSRNLSGILRVQACDEQVCYAPGAIDLTFPVTIK
jgi:hypothetical protein